MAFPGRPFQLRCLAFMEICHELSKSRFHSLANHARELTAQIGHRLRQPNRQRRMLHNSSRHFDRLDLDGTCGLVRDSTTLLIDPYNVPW